MDALRSLDFAAVDVSALLVECHSPDCVALLQGAGYATLFLTHRSDGMR
eukprot:gene15025-26680_t